MRLPHTSLSLLHPSTFMDDGWLANCSNVGDRILREETNQQIRVLNLNRRPNINSRQVLLPPRHRSSLSLPPPPPSSICPAHAVFLVSLTRSSSVLRYTQCRIYATDTPDLWHRLAPKRYLRAPFGETKQHKQLTTHRYISRISFNRRIESFLRR